MAGPARAYDMYWPKYPCELEWSVTGARDQSNPLLRGKREAASAPAAASAATAAV